MKGPYFARQASAKASQSASTPWTLPNCLPCWMMLLRQSTTVPNTSKISAFTSVTSIMMLLSVPTPTLVRCPPSLSQGHSGSCRRRSENTLLAEVPAILNMTRHTTRVGQQTSGCIPTIPLSVAYVQRQGCCAGRLDEARHWESGRVVETWVDKDAWEVLLHLTQALRSALDACMGHCTMRCKRAVRRGQRARGALNARAAPRETSMCRSGSRRAGDRGAPCSSSQV